MNTRLSWKVDENNHVELKSSFLSKRIVLVNGKEVLRVPLKNTSIPFSLNGGKQATMTVKPGIALYPDNELEVEGQVVLSEYEAGNLSCLRCGKNAKPTDKFCERCGVEIPPGAVQRKMMKLKGARKAIAIVAGMFFIFGGIMYSIQDSTASKALQNIAALGDAEIYPELINGKEMTGAELRKEIQREPWLVLATNLILGLVMVALYIYAKKSPLVALLAALGVYVSVIVMNAVIDPKTIGQGIFIKIIVVGVLFNGIQSALQLRKINA